MQQNKQRIIENKHFQTPIKAEKKHEKTQIQTYKKSVTSLSFFSLRFK